MARRFDLLAGLLLLQQLLERLLVMILEAARVEVCLLGVDDMLRQLEHIPGDLLVGNILEIFPLFPHLIGIAQGYTQHAVAARFERDDVLARGEHHLADRHHALAWRMASRITAKACCPTSPSGTM